METLALLVVFIVLAVIFFAAFTGFIVGDNVDSMAVIATLGVLPGIGSSFIFQNYLFTLLWVFSYWLGFQVGRLLR